MRKNICKLLNIYLVRGYYPKCIRKPYTSVAKKKKKSWSKNEQRTLIGISLKKTHKWPTDQQLGAQCH